MPIRKLLVVLPLSIALALGGCTVTTSSQRVASLGESGQTKSPKSVLKTDYTGEYSLYATSAGPKDRRRTLIRTIRLGKGERIGFQSRGGTAVAVAGNAEITLDPGQYRWELKADRGQIDWPHTTVLVLLIAVVVILCIVTGVAIYAAVVLP